MTVLRADLGLEEHRAAVLSLTDQYARDPMGGGEPLAPEVASRLVAGLAEHPTSMIFLGFREGLPSGIATCFRGFSTFAAAPLVNLHDFFVAPSARGTGLGRALLRAVEEEARQGGACKLTLEVLASNHHARKIYEKFGFTPAPAGENTRGTFFLTKPLG